VPHSDDDLERSVKLVEDRFQLKVVVTLGPDGCFIGGTRLDAYASARAVDTVGAGDCFCAATGVHLDEENSSLESAVTFAVVAAGLSVGVAGAQTAPTRRQIESALSL